MDSPEVREALKLIDNLRLPHLDSRLLSSYINEALDPDLAASYVTENLRVGDAHSLLANWTYIVEASMYSLRFLHLVWTIYQLPLTP